MIGNESMDELHQAWSELDRLEQEEITAVKRLLHIRMTIKACRTKIDVLLKKTPCHRPPPSRTTLVDIQIFHLWPRQSWAMDAKALQCIAYLARCGPGQFTDTIEEVLPNPASHFNSWMARLLSAFGRLISRIIGSHPSNYGPLEYPLSKFVRARGSNYSQTQIYITSFSHKGRLCFTIVSLGSSKSDPRTTPFNNSTHTAQGSPTEISFGVPSNAHLFSHIHVSVTCWIWSCLGTREG